MTHDQSPFVADDLKWRWWHWPVAALVFIPVAVGIVFFIALVLVSGINDWWQDRRKDKL